MASVVEELVNSNTVEYTAIVRETVKFIVCNNIWYETGKWSFAMKNVKRKKKKINKTLVHIRSHPL